MLPNIVVFTMANKHQQLDGLEQLLDKLEEYKDTDSSALFYAMLTEKYERICYDGPIKKVTCFVY